MPKLHQMSHGKFLLGILGILISGIPRLYSPASATALAFQHQHPKALAATRIECLSLFPNSDSLGLLTLKVDGRRQVHGGPPGRGASRCPGGVSVVSRWFLGGFLVVSWWFCSRVLVVSW